LKQFVITTKAKYHFGPLIKAGAFAGIKKHERIQDGDCIAISECRTNEDYVPISLPKIPLHWSYPVFYKLQCVNA